MRKLNYFNNHFIPASNFKFPTKQYGSRQRSFQFAWLNKFNGLVYSADDKGAYCKFCVLFGKFSGKRINTLGVLIEQPLTNWKKATEKLTAHFSGAKYHMEAMELASNFQSIMNNKMPSIRHQIDSLALQRIQQNRIILKSIIDTVILCGQQGIPLRGHRDDHTSLTSNPDQNHGNFLELLNFRIRAGDSALEQHLSTAARNATYTSKTIQNEIIHLCGKMIQRSILSAVQSSPFYSVIADEASDSANDEQLAISLRYLTANGQPQEKFLSFTECLSGVSGEALASTILKQLSEWALDLRFLRGQAYDGAGAMAGCSKGVATRIQDKFPKALYTHCAAHRLNLCVVKCCSIREISNMMGTADSVVRYFKYSPKRQQYFEECIDAEFNTTGTKEKRTKLKELCRTRWVERHDAFAVFVDFLKPLVVCLDNINSNNGREWNRESRADAYSLLLALQKFSFVVCLIVAREILAITKPLSAQLQGSYTDIARAHRDIDQVKRQVRKNRNDLNKFHTLVYNKACDVARDIGVLQEDMPRTTSHQQHRSNPPYETPKDYYRLVITAPMLDHLHSQLEERFSDTSFSYINEFLNLLPCKVCDFDDLGREKIPAITKLYIDDLPEEYALDMELQAWYLKWKQHPKAKEINTLPKALVALDKATFPNLFVLLQIGATLPVTSATCERSISTLRFLKDELRSTMTNRRLNGLALMFIHRDLTKHLNIDDIVDEFAREHPRRMELVNLLSDDAETV